MRQTSPQFVVQDFAVARRVGPSTKSPGCRSSQAEDGQWFSLPMHREHTHRQLVDHADESIWISSNDHIGSKNQKTCIFRYSNLPKLLSPEKMKPSQEEGIISRGRRKNLIGRPFPNKFVWNQARVTNGGGDPKHSETAAEYEP